MKNRRQEIVKILKEKNYATVSELSQMINYSESTIRRDLAYLEENRLIKRVPGGAMILRSNFTELPWNYKYRVAVEEKEYIADLALDLIEDYNSLILDSSSTSYYLAKRLQEKKGLTIFTSNMFTALIAKNETNNIYILGGKLYDVTGTGNLTLQAVKSIQVDLFFMSCRAFKIKEGTFERVEIEVPIKRAMANNAEKTILMLDSSKFDKRFLFKCIDTSQIDYIISDKNIDVRIRKEISESGIELLS